MTNIVLARASDVTDFDGGLRNAGQLTVVTGRDGFKLTFEKIWMQLCRGVID